jgi:hypothetical protein
MKTEIRFPICNDNHDLIAHKDGPCPLCKALADCNAALDKIQQLEFEASTLEEKVRLLENLS